jgi:leucyl/phenylalanyl-tRNA--protein transferase
LYSLTVDTHFSDVIEACAEPRPDQHGTWITEEMQTAYIRLHHLGHAHAVEVWSEDKLVGGIYGLALGRVFFGESMFSRARDASKIALVALCRQIHRWGFEILDCQVKNPHLVNMGAVEISRQKFRQHLKAALDEDQWQADFSAESKW